MKIHQAIKIKSTGRVIGYFYRLREDGILQYVSFSSTVESIEASKVEPATDADRTYFLTTLSVHRRATSKSKAEVEAPVETQVEAKDQMRERILKFCLIPRSRKEILDHIGLSNHTKNYEKYIKPLLEKKQLRLTIPESPRSSRQKYVAANSEGHE